MFKHTMTSVNIIKSELSLLSYLANIISSVFMIGYLIFSAATGRGILWVNIALCILSVVNFITYLVTRERCNRETKAVRKFVRRFYGISRVILNAIPLGSVLYLLAFTNEEIGRLELVFLPLIILVWLAQVVLEISSIYIESRITLFVDGLKMDIEPFMKIKNAISGDSTKNSDLNISEGNRALLTEEAEKYIDEKNAEAESTPKDNVVKRIANTVGIIKEYIKK